MSFKLANIVGRAALIDGENYYDLDLIEHSTEAYDYKRGFCTLTADVVVSAQNLMNSSADLTGWTVSFKTDGGVLSFDA